MSLADVQYPLGATLLSGAATWRFCLRPMRTGQHCGASPGTPLADTKPLVVPQTTRAAELEALRAEVRELSQRHEASQL